MVFRYVTHVAAFAPWQCRIEPTEEVSSKFRVLFRNILMFDRARMLVWKLCRS